MVSRGLVRGGLGVGRRGASGIGRRFAKPPWPGVVAAHRGGTARAALTGRA